MVFAIAAVIILIPFDNFEMEALGIEVSLSDIVILISGSVFLIRILLSEQIKSISPWIHLLWSVYLLSSLIVLSQGNTRIFVTQVGVFILFYLTILTTRNISNLRMLMKVYLFSALLHSLIGLFVYWQYQQTGNLSGIFLAKISGIPTPRVMSVFGDPNFYALYLLPAFAILLVILFYERSLKIKIGLVAFIILLAVGIGASYSRTGIMAMPILLMSTIVWKWGGSFRTLLLGTLAVLLGTTFVLLPLIDMPIISDIAAWNIQAVNYRYYSYGVATSIWSESLLWGTGLTPPEFTVHNTLLIIGVRSGLFGSVPFILLLVVAFRSNIRKISHTNWNDSKWIAAAGSAMFCLIPPLMFFDIEFNKVLWLILGLVTASAFFVENDQSNSITKTETSKIDNTPTLVD